MAFDFDQPSYVAFRKVIAERTRQVVVICGAGLSRSAGLPSWVELKTRLIAAAKKEVQYRKDSRQKDEHLIGVAEHEADLWMALKFLRRAMLETSYTAEIRSAFANAASASPPDEYVDLWRLPLGGIVTLNVDGFVGRAFAERFGGAREVRQFSGIDCDRHTDLFTSGKEFVVNLHGVLPEVKSWVFTADDLENLMRIEAYQQFISTLFTSRTVLFIGITADDPAISRHLARLKAIGFSGGEHYWITHRSDAATVAWAQDHKVRIIFYNSEDHSDVSIIVKDINKWVPRETEPPPVLPSTSKERGFVLPPPEEIERLSAEEIRQSLNKEASRILHSGDPAREARYAEFWKKYAEAIHRAWSVTSVAPRNIFMGFKINSPLTKGGFGSIYDAERTDGERVAIKVLHNVAKDDHATLVSFRRGVRAMRILTPFADPVAARFIFRSLTLSVRTSQFTLSIREKTGALGTR
ncbi:SIR2 family protein [Oleiharenicola sp. Vm1]|uniref:SIR2 family NAD-dependent protein deacylase n=1 Tax=Oleiharenicola sp. Vm1 TaxID=3398393 RepID=UPI0039F641E2